MLFPNFYVSSMGVNDERFSDRSRMSLSHLARPQQLRDGFHRAFTTGANPGAFSEANKPSKGQFSSSSISFVNRPRDRNFFPQPEFNWI